MCGGRYVMFEREAQESHFRHELTHYTHSHYYEHLYHSFVSLEKILKQQLSNAHSNVTKYSDTNARTQVQHDRG